MWTQKRYLRNFTLRSIGYSEMQSYPRAHTCFNRLDVPLYPSKALLETVLRNVIQCDVTGFNAF